MWNVVSPFVFGSLPALAAACVADRTVWEIFMTKRVKIIRVDTKTRKKNKRNINDEDVRILTFWNLLLADNSVLGSPHTCSSCAHMHFSPMRLLPAGTLPWGFNTYLIIILHYMSYIHIYTIEKGLNVYIVRTVCTL